MTQTKKLDQETWLEFLDMFSNGNKGRKITVKVQDPSIGEQTLIDAASFFSVVYDSIEKGNDLIISLGENNIESTHTVDDPVEIWETRDEEGRAVSLEILNQNEERTKIIFDLDGATDDLYK